MYQLVSAMLKPVGKNTAWKSVDISGMTLKDVFTGFSAGHITLTNPAIGPGNFFVDLNTLRHDPIPFVNLAFNLWLASLGSTLLTHTTEPVYDTQTILYADANQARFNIQRVWPDDPEAVGHLVNDMTDLFLNKSGIDYTVLQSYVLTTVNGFAHPNVAHENGLIIKDGAKSKDISNKTLVGLISFAKIGTAFEKPITLSMLSTPPGETINNVVYITLNEDTTGKTLMLSIGGYLHAEDPVFSVISTNPTVIRVEMNLIDHARRYFEMRRFLDVSGLGLTASPTAPNAVLIDELFGEQYAIRLLTMLQSFIVVVDAPMLYRDHIMPFRPSMYGHYETAEEPKFPLRHPTGRVMDYWFSREKERWVLAVEDNLYSDYVYETTDWKNQKAIAEVRSPDTPQPLSPAHLLSISCTRVS